MVDTYSEWFKRFYESARKNRESNEWHDTFDWKDVHLLIEKKETLSAVITAHNHVEVALKLSLSMFSRMAEPKDSINVKLLENLKFSELVNLCFFLKVIDENTYAQLKKFNQLRNNWAHGFILRDNLDDKAALKEAKGAKKMIKVVFRGLFTKYKKLIGWDGKDMFMFPKENPSKAK